MKKNNTFCNYFIVKDFTAIMIIVVCPSSVDQKK